MRTPISRFPGSEWFTWLLHLFVGAGLGGLAGIFMGYMSGYQQVRYTRAGLDSFPSVMPFIWSSAMVGASLVSLYGREWSWGLPHRVIPDAEAVQGRASRLISAMIGLIGGAGFLAAIIRHLKVFL